MYTGLACHCSPHGEGGRAVQATLVLLVDVPGAAHCCFTACSRWVDLLSVSRRLVRPGRAPKIRGGPIRGSVVVLRVEESPDLADVEVFGDPEGPTERSTALCGVEASRIGMEPRTPAGEAAPRVRNNDTGHGHDTQ
jgi:hypothetical protein